jgi:hypothetical protein
MRSRVREKIKIKIKLKDVFELVSSLEDEGQTVSVDVQKLLLGKGTTKPSARNLVSPLVLLMEEAEVHTPKVSKIVSKRMEMKTTYWLMRPWCCHVSSAPTVRRM